MILSGCASDALRKAATEQGRAQAGVTLPPYPEDCRKKEAHAPLVEGGEVRSTLKREREALKRQNSRTDRCAKFYDAVTEGLK